MFGVADDETAIAQGNIRAIDMADAVNKCVVEFGRRIGEKFIEICKDRREYCG